MKIGVYIHDGFTFEPRSECPYYWNVADYARFLDWLKTAGVEMVENCQQMGWYRYPVLPEELDRLRVRQGLIEEAHRRGMGYWQILGANLLSQLPWDRVPAGQLELTEANCTVCPQEGDNFQRTAELSQYFARTFKGAQAFEIFAGDWGGCGCGGCGLDTYQQYIDYHAHRLAQEQPEAQVYANLWSISSWQPRQGGILSSFDDPRWRRMWDDEIRMSEQFLSRLDSIPQGVGFSFPLHHWYRGFCQQWYRQDELPFWPSQEFLTELHHQGRKLVAWTHFIVENDPYHGRLWGTLSARLRYLRALTTQLLKAPLEAVMGNVYSARQALNLYAFVRFCREPELSVEDALAGFVEQVALPGGREYLFDLLIYLENRDPWQADLPEYRRLPRVPEKASPQSIERDLAGLAQRLNPESPLLLNGVEYFARSAEAAWRLSQ